MLTGIKYKDTIWWKVIQYGLEYLGLHYGVYRAFVVENEDPEKLDRLQLRIPHLNAYSDDQTWAFPKGVWGGKNYGMNLLPLKGDMVFVEFMKGDPDYPIWSHAGYARDEKPAEFLNSNYGFKTPRGTLILINDKKGEEEVYIKHKSNNEWTRIKAGEYEMEAALIKLGKDGDEQAVLGNTLKDKLNQLDSKLDDLLQALMNHTHTSNSGPTGVPINIIDFTQIKSEIAQLDMTLEDILSNKVKLDQ